MKSEGEKMGKRSASHVLMVIRSFFDKMISIIYDWNQCGQELVQPTQLRMANGRKSKLLKKCYHLVERQGKGGGNGAGKGQSKYKSTIGVKIIHETCFK